MILKSYELERDIKKILNFKSILIYGENVGLKQSFKKKIINLYKNSDILNIYQEDFTKNKNILTNEINNISLFAKSKLIIVNHISNEILDSINQMLEGETTDQIVFIGDMIDKKSKVRSLFEKNKKLGVIPCYQDNEITLKYLIQSELKDFKNLNYNTVNLILKHSNLNRNTVLNNLEKIKTYFDIKTINDNDLETLLDTDRNEIFENIRDAALDGNKNKLNDLLSNFAFSNESVYQYLNAINFRFQRVLQIHNQNLTNNIDETINNIKPPIFWKDKPKFKQLAEKWRKSRLLEAIKYMNKLEMSLKKNSSIDQKTLLKNSITNICSNSFSYF